MRILATLTAAALLALAGCGGGTDGDSDSTRTSVDSTTASSAVAAATAGAAECTDPSGDGRSGPGTDLVKVSLTRQAEGTLTVRYELAGPATPPAQFASWVIAFDIGVTPLMTLGVKVAGSEAPTSYAFDFRNGSQTALDSPKTIEGNVVTGVFPLDLDPALAGSFHWRAVASDAGNEADSCEGTLS